VSLKDKLKLYLDKNYNVLISGKHGIGKTTIAKELAKENNLVLKYYSASTLDPFADLVGIPAPDFKTNSLKFFRPDDIKTAEIIFFDELNRAHPRVLNSVLEIIQFKSVNGVKLENLKMVWAAINPPNGDYQVEDLDPALVDRFHVFIKMEPEVNLEYMSNLFGKKVAKALKDWWDFDLSDDQRNLISPRRMEYVGCMVNDGMDVSDVMPPGNIFPIPDLKNRIEAAIGYNNDENIDINKESILTKKEYFVTKLKEKPSIALKLHPVMAIFNEQEMFDCRDIIENMPKEIVVKISSKKFKIVKRYLKELFEAEKIDLKLYPKISEAFGF